MRWRTSREKTKERAIDVDESRWSLDRPSYFQCLSFVHASSCSRHLAQCAQGQEERHNTALTSESKTKPPFTQTKNSLTQLQFDARSSGSSRIVAGGVASSAPTSASTSSSSSSSSSSACYDEELYFRGRTVLSSACGVTTKRYTCSERVVAAEYCSFSSSSSSSSAPGIDDGDDADNSEDAGDDAGSRDSSGAADEALAVVCESSVVSLCPGAAAVECPLDRGGRDRA